MLQTSMIDELPSLFSSTVSTSTGTSAGAFSSSCAMQERLIIQPLVAATGPVTFDWSNFPIVQRDDLLLYDTAVDMSCCEQGTSNKKQRPLHEDLSADLISTCSSDSALSTSTSTSKSRRVSFAPTINVRTHAVVLGEHPCCAQLALELGWDHDEGSVQELLDYPSRRSLRKRSYFERKAILKEVTGMTDEEIRKTTLRHAAPSTRDLSVMQGITL